MEKSWEVDWTKVVMMGHSVVSPLHNGDAPQSYEVLIYLRGGHTLNLCDDEDGTKYNQLRKTWMAFR